MKEIKFNPKINYLDIESYEDSSYKIASEIIIEEDFDIIKQIIIFLIHDSNTNIRPTNLYYILKTIEYLSEDYIVNNKSIESTTTLPISPLTEYARDYISKYISIQLDSDKEEETFELKLKRKVVKNLIEGNGICKMERMFELMNKYPHLIALLCKDGEDGLYINDLGKLIAGVAENSFKTSEQLLNYLN